MSIQRFTPANIGLIIMSILLICFLLYAWRIIRRNAGEQNTMIFRKPVFVFVIIYTIYFTAICLLSHSGFFNSVTTPPRALFIFVPIVLTVLILLKASTKRSLMLLQYLPAVVLILIQSFRIIIEMILLQLYNEQLIPKELTLHGRNFDVVIGILALPVALLFYKKHQFAVKAGILFNVLGLISLVNIFSIAIPSVPSTIRIYELNYLPTYFPGVLILFIAPLALYLHVLSLRQLMMRKNQ